MKTRGKKYRFFESLVSSKLASLKLNRNDRLNFTDACKILEESFYSSRDLFKIYSKDHHAETKVPMLRISISATRSYTSKDLKARRRIPIMIKLPFSFCDIRDVYNFPRI